jgi:hypothetical protein
MGKVALVKLVSFCAVSLCLLLVMFYPTITHAQMTSQAHRTVTLKPSDFLTGPFFLMATEIDGTNAHLDDTNQGTLAYPVLTMESSTIYGLKITHPITSNLTMVISSGSTAPATSTGVAIRTFLGDLIADSPPSSISPVVLAELALGQTVSSVTIKNENLKVDNYLNSTTISIPDAQITIQAS